MKFFIVVAICLQVALATPVNWRPYESGEFEGDIMLTPKQRNGLILESARWRNGRIPYVIEGSFNAEELQNIQDGMNHYHQNTCIRFEPKLATDRDYIAIVNNEQGCKAFVGRLGIGRQTVNFGPGCLGGGQIGVAVHELMHAIGFWHEQNRSDRDLYLSVYTDNVENNQKHNFNKLQRAQVSDVEVKYDYNSIMHYGRTAFSSNSQNTMIPKKPIFIGHYFALSTGDIKKIQAMYYLECN